MVGFFLCVFWGGEGERDCVGFFLGENTSGSWTWLFTLQADLDWKCNPSNSSDAQQDRECQGLFNSDLSKKLNIDGHWTNLVKAVGNLIAMGQREELGQGREKPGKAMECSLYIVQKVTIRFKQLKNTFYPKNTDYLILHICLPKVIKHKSSPSSTFDHRHLFFLQIQLSLVLIIMD